MHSYCLLWCSHVMPAHLQSLSLGKEPKILDPNDLVICYPIPQLCTILFAQIILIKSRHDATLKSNWDFF